MEWSGLAMWNNRQCDMWLCMKIEMDMERKKISYQRTDQGDWADGLVEQQNLFHE